jgi:hypothetical protein
VLTSLEKVAALAGRRPDPVGTPEPRFPLDAVSGVRKRIHQTLAAYEIETLVCSAASGADLLALGAACDLGIRCRIVLPFSPKKFRQLSVTDRPGDWGACFDRVIAKAERQENLVVLGSKGTNEAAFAAANERILAEALKVHKNASPARSVLAIAVWDGVRHGQDDATAGFRDAALRLGLPIVDVSTAVS